MNRNTWLMIVLYPFILVGMIFSVVFLAWKITKAIAEGL